MTTRTARLMVRSALGLAVAMLVGSASALADDTPPVDGAPPAGGDPAAAAPAATPPAAVAYAGGPADVTLRQAGVSVDGDAVINMSKSENMSKSKIGQPIQIVPNLYFGISNELTVGFAHNPGAEVFQTAGRGLCITGVSNGCAHVYDNFSIDALFSLMRARAVDVAAHAGADFLSLRPLRLSVRVGAKAKAVAGPLVVVFDPSVNIGAANRSDDNEETLSLPLRLGVMAGSRLNLGVSAGVFGPFDHLSDSYAIPVGAGGAFAVNQAVDIRAQFTFTNLAGKDGSSDDRALSVGAAYRM